MERATLRNLHRWRNNLCSQRHRRVAILETVSRRETMFHPSAIWDCWNTNCHRKVTKRVNRMKHPCT